MSESEDIDFYRATATAAATARSLPLADAIRFLRGALLVAGESPEMTDVRNAYIGLQANDAQLELIASGQLKLNLGGDAK